MPTPRAVHSSSPDSFGLRAGLSKAARRIFRRVVRCSEKMTPTAFAWRNFAQLGTFSPNLLSPGRAARVTLGVVLPLIAGWQSGHLDYGAYMALGALPAGMASFQGATRSRVAAVLVASIGMAISTFVGTVTAASMPWLLVPIIAIWAYLTGLTVCLGPRWSVAVLQWSVALLIATGFPQGPSEAALRAGLVLAGGLLQAILVAASWTLRPGRIERAAFAASYGGLAKYASDVAKGMSGPPPPMPFPARAAVEDPNPLLARNLRLLYIDLVEETERIRASLAALAAQMREDAADVGDLCAFMAQAATVLAQLADAPPMARTDREMPLRDLEARMAHLTIPENATWRWSGEALLGQLRAVARMIASVDAPRPPVARTSTTNADGSRVWDEFAFSLATSRANVTTASEAGRHALRLALIAALTEAIVQATGLYQGRWATLTIFLVLKPDYASTMYRGFQRALGTAVGAAVGAMVAELAHQSQAAWIAAAGIAIAIAYAVFDASYLIFSVFLTTFIVVLLVMIGMPAVSTAEKRGSTKHSSAQRSRSLRTWSGRRGSEPGCRTSSRGSSMRIASTRWRYSAGSRIRPRWKLPSSGHCKSPHVAPAAMPRPLRRASRLSLPAAEFAPETAELVIAAVSRFAHAELALHALVLARDQQTAANSVPRESVASVHQLRTVIGDALGRIALGLRTLRPSSPIPALRPLYSELAAAPGLHDSPLVAIVDQLVDATKTLDAVVRDRLRVETGGQNQAAVTTSNPDALSKSRGMT